MKRTTLAIHLLLILFAIPLTHTVNTFAFERGREGLGEDRREEEELRMEEKRREEERRFREAELARHEHPVIIAPAPVVAAPPPPSPGISIILPVEIRIQ